MAVRREEVEGTWLALLDGRSTREEAARWAAERENEHFADDIIVEVGLQNLANLDQRIWPHDSKRPEARPGEYMQPIEQVTQLFAGWKENCAAYDADPNESPMDVKGQFGVDGDAARHDMKGSLEMSRTDSY